MRPGNGTFTGLSPADNGRMAASSDTSWGDGGSGRSSLRRARHLLPARPRLRRAGHPGRGRRLRDDGGLRLGVPDGLLARALAVGLREFSHSRPVRYIREALDARRSDILRASPRMFESDLLDRLSRVHPLVPLFIFVPVVGVLFVVGARELTTAGTLGLLLAGWLFWTLTEYWLHRLVFHFEPEEGPGAR